MNTVFLDFDATIISQSNFGSVGESNFAVVGESNFALSSSTKEVLPGLYSILSKSRFGNINKFIADATLNRIYG